MMDMEIEELARQVVDAAFQVHKELGPGLLESVYEICLCRELSLRGVSYVSQAAMPINYKGIAVDSGLRLDLIVDRKIIVELKAVELLLPVHEAQLLTYLKLSGLNLGFLINFNVPLIKDGIKRRII